GSGAAAAGVKLDRYVGGPYVATKTSTIAGSTSIILTRSTNALACPAIPTVGDVIRLDGTDATVRPQLSGMPTVVAAASSREDITCPLATPLSTTVTGTSGSVLTAKLVRQVAFIVMPNGS